MRNCYYYPLPTLREWSWTLDNVYCQRSHERIMCQLLLKWFRKRRSFRKSLAQDKGDTTATLNNLVGQRISDPISAQQAVAQVLQINGFRITSRVSDKKTKTYVCLLRKKSEGQGVASRGFINLSGTISGTSSNTINPLLVH